MRTSTQEAVGTSNVIRGAIGYSFMDMMFYIFYLPLAFTGPILTYDLFKAQVKCTSILSTFKPGSMVTSVKQPAAIKVRTVFCDHRCLF